jgi:hypothetical protein
MRIAAQRFSFWHSRLGQGVIEELLAQPAGQRRQIWYEGSMWFWPFGHPQRSDRHIRPHAGHSNNVAYSKWLQQRLVEVVKTALTAWPGASWIREPLATFRSKAATRMAGTKCRAAPLPPGLRSSFRNTWLRCSQNCGRSDAGAVIGGFDRVRAPSRADYSIFASFREFGCPRTSTQML